MRVIFYHPRTLKILGMSDGDTNALAFPYLLTEEDYNDFRNLRVQRDENGTPQLVVLS